MSAATAKPDLIKLDPNRTRLHPRMLIRCQAASFYKESKPKAGGNPEESTTASVAESDRMTAAAAEDNDTEEKTLIEIIDPSSTLLDLAKYVSFVRSPICGAIATFEGTTRDTFDGRRVVELCYEAYGPMALRQLWEMCTAARARWAVERVAVAHRLGSVPVGEASVFVAVSSVHRADALAACGFLIDEVKASVPIWKKEVYEDGEVWKENQEFLERWCKTAGGTVPVPEEDRKGRCCGDKVNVESEEAHVSADPMGGEKDKGGSIAVDQHGVELSTCGDGS